MLHGPKTETLKKKKTQLRSKICLLQIVLKFFRTEKKLTSMRPYMHELQKLELCPITSQEEFMSFCIPALVVTATDVAWHFFF